LVLLRSLTKHDPDQHIGDVVILWVSKDPPWKHQQQLDELQAEVTKTRKYTLHDFSEQLRNPTYPCLAWNQNGTLCVTHMKGWFAQMSLKLKIASLIDSEYYLLVDSKNAFFSDIDENTFFTPCNRARLWGKYRWDQIPEPHDKWYAKSAGFLKLSLEDKWFPTSITPALLNTRIVLDMLKHIGEKDDPKKICDGPLCRWFGSEATEFTLYNVYSLAQSEFSDCVHKMEIPDEQVHEWSTTLWHAVSLYANAETCEAVANYSLQPLTFGVQSRDDHADTEQSASEIASLRERLRSCLTTVYARAGLYDAGVISAASFSDCIS